jgi:hypothetical protein
LQLVTWVESRRSECSASRCEVVHSTVCSEGEGTRQLCCCGLAGERGWSSTDAGERGKGVGRREGEDGLHVDVLYDCKERGSTPLLK